MVLHFQFANVSMDLEYADNIFSLNLEGVVVFVMAFEDEGIF